MANFQHLKPKAYSTSRRPRAVARRCQERRVKVKKGYYERPFRQQPATEPYSAPRPVPWVQLKGYWLEAAGFIIDTPIKVRVMEGCLVLTVLVGPGEAQEDE